VYKYTFGAQLLIRMYLLRNATCSADGIDVRHHERTQSAPIMLIHLPHDFRNSKRAVLRYNKVGKSSRDEIGLEKRWKKGRSCTFSALGSNENHPAIALSGRYKRLRKPQPKASTTHKASPNPDNSAQKSSFYFSNTANQRSRCLSNSTP
jgi:hypothetical protein